MRVEWPLADATGSVIAMLDLTGGLANRFVRDSFGDPIASLQPEWSIGFHGREYSSALGLSDVRRRAYMPALGRFVQEDAIAPMGYDYGANNPLVFVDPFGESVLTERVVLFVAVFSVARSAYWLYECGIGEPVDIPLYPIVSRLPGGERIPRRDRLPGPFCVLAGLLKLAEPWK